MLARHAYPELAVAELGHFLDEIGREVARVRSSAAHRVGAFAVGDLAVVAAASGVHGGEAFRPRREVVGRVKARAPISRSRARPRWSLLGRFRRCAVFVR